MSVREHVMTAFRCADGPMAMRDIKNAIESAGHVLHGRTVERVVGSLVDEGRLEKFHTRGLPRSAFDRNSVETPHGRYFFHTYRKLWLYAKISTGFEVDAKQEMASDVSRLAVDVRWAGKGRPDVQTMLIALEAKVCELLDAVALKAIAMGIEIPERFLNDAVKSTLKLLEV